MSRMNTLVLAAFFFGLMVLGTLIGSWYVLSKESSTQISASQILPALEPTPATIPEFKPEKPQQKTLEQISPEGAMLLSVEISGDNYQLFVTEQTDDEDTQDDQPAANPQLVYSGQLESDQQIEVPFNAWSPDNVHFFIKRTQNNTSEFLVFKASGEPFTAKSEQTTTQPFINVTQHFVESEITYQLHDITGWAANSLLMVQTDKPTYWFDVSNQRFILLSTQF